MFDLEKRYRHYAERMRAFMDARNITGEIGAEMIGAHPTTVYDLRRGATRLDDEWRMKVAAGFGIDPDMLFGDAPLPAPAPHEIRPAKRRGRKPAARPPATRMLSVFGLAAGSIQGAHALTVEPIDEVPCPPGLTHALGAYALETRGESMVPRYFPKDILYVNPHQAPRPGDHVIVQVRLYDGSGTETWVKRYDGEDGRFVRTWQYNPPGEIKFDRRFVVSVHRVLPINELFLAVRT